MQNLSINVSDISFSDENKIIVNEYNLLLP